MAVALARPVELISTHVAGETLSAYFDGELSLKDRRYVEAHLQRCGACRATLRDYRGASGLMRTLVTHEVPEQLGRDLLQRLPRS